MANIVRSSNPDEVLNLFRSCKNCIRDLISITYFLNSSFTVVFDSGLQHEVIRPTEPYGLPLNFTTLPQQLKKAGMTFIIKISH